MINKTAAHRLETLRRAYAGGGAGCRRRRSAWRPTGGLFALNSYENRVYQLGAGERAAGAEVLPAGALERRADRRGAPVHGRACRGRVAGGGARSASTARRCSGTANSALRPSPGCAAARRSSMRPRRGRSSGAAWRGCIRSARGGRSRRARASACSASGWEARAQVLGSELLPEALHERYSSVSGALLERVSAAFDAAAGDARDPPARGLPSGESAVERARAGVRGPR